MADFGIAAQIGRGGMGGGGGVAAPPDPANRMLQLMQLQQLQQNMMLARQQEGRAAALAPLQRGQLEASTAADVARTTATREQATKAKIEREEAERAVRVNRGMIDVMDRVDRGLLDLSTPEGFRAITDPEVRTAVRKQMMEAREAAAKAEKAGLELDGVKRAAAYKFVDRFGEGITGPREYGVARTKLILVDPTAAEFLPDNYNPDNAARLRDFVRDRKTSIQMVNGVPVMVTEGSPRAQELTIQRAPPQGTLVPVQPGAALPPDAAARAAAGTPSDVGASQGIIGQRLPAAGEPGFVPAALSASQFVQQQEQEKEDRNKPRTKAEFQATLNDVTRNYRKLGEMGVLITPQTEPVQRVKTFLASQAPGVAGVISPEMGGPMQAIQNLRQSLVSSLMGATGMTAKQIDSNVEMKAYLDSLTSPGQTAEAIVDTFNAMSRRFGLGQTLSVSDLTGRASGPAQPARGRREPAAASAAGSLSPQDQQALQWANSNPNDPRAAAIKQRLGVQ